ncbi:MAG: A/G-specific adenine glycosylase [Pseudomonadota bacterium]
MNNTSEPKAKDLTDFAPRLLEWYRAHARAMPWRIPPHDHLQGVRADPYRVWLSEIMLQQTQVATVKDYFLKFVALWPDVEDLAAADLEDVLKAWAGLGYYSRARNLKKCADQIVQEHGGRFPQTPEGLKALPGIGDYTAAAIASIAFDVPEPVVDGNIERVISRYFRVETPFPKAKVQTRDWVAKVLDRNAPGEFAQAMMDLGATVCTPKKPSCMLCPLSADCGGRLKGDAETFPRKLPKKEKPTRTGAAFVLLNSRDEVFLCKRGDSGLLAGMTQVPTTNWTASQDGTVDTCEAPVTADWQNAGIARHTFTHFHLQLTVYKAVANKQPGIEGWWCPARGIRSEALPKVMLKAIDIALKH